MNKIHHKSWQQTVTAPLLFARLEPGYNLRNHRMKGNQSSKTLEEYPGRLVKSYIVNLSLILPPKDLQPFTRVLVHLYYVLALKCPHRWGFWKVIGLWAHKWFFRRWNLVGRGGSVGAWPGKGYLPIILCLLPAAMPWVTLLAIPVCHATHATLEPGGHRLKPLLI